MSTACWQFWIDVGGTFTDCIARSPDGRLLRHKLLSSGITKGSVGEGSNASRIQDPARRGDPDNFWRDYRLRWVERSGRVLGDSAVVSSDGHPGVLELASQLPKEPALGDTYELVSPEEAPILAVRYLLGCSLADPLPPVALRLGTTRGTNTLLTRRGARTALVTTRGLGDILRIDYQDRPRLFDLAIRKPSPLFEQVLEVDERISSDGHVLERPDVDHLRSALIRLRQQGVQSLAICLLHAYRYPEHEQLVEQLARETGFDEISRSSKIAPLIKIVSRGHTTVVDAYLNPVLRSYVARLRESLGAGPADELRILTSAGGLVDADHFVGKDSILSGPAGGVVGFSRIAEAAGFDRAIGFDMGGTSTDVSRYDGQFEFEHETEKAGVRVVAPMLSIETVAAGGGSVCWFDGVKLAVGPDSAGADPGPACYGRGGPLAVTDLNFFLGKILPEHFPFRLDADAVQTRLEEKCREVEQASGQHYEPVELADGFLRVANAKMAKAIRSISIAKGYDPQEYVLVAFGGAAPQHACALAQQLGIRTILNHPDAGILSAYGVGLADVTRHRAVGVYQPFDRDQLRALENTFQQMAEEARREVLAEGVVPQRIEESRCLDLRYQGTDVPLTISEPNRGDYAGEFEKEHRRQYGYVHEGRQLEIVAARLEVVGRSDVAVQPARPVAAKRSPRRPATTTAIFAAESLQTALFRRTELQPGDQIQGPAIILESLSTTVVDPGWLAEMLSGGELLLTRQASAAGSDRGKETAAQAMEPGEAEREPTAPSAPSSPSPVMLEIFNNHFAGIAQQMGITLRNTSTSVNVKERLDFSCALFTPAGGLVVNAPHIPVHLGAMSETVKRVVADNPHMRPGDVYVTNDPYRGGSHLPDVTVVTPVHEEVTGELRFFTASRAHHAEIGGIAPGSMPPFSKNLAEEGVVLRNFKLVDAGTSRMELLKQHLLAPPYPTRNVNDNLADISAQVAANRQGAQDLQRLIQQYSWPVVHSYMEHIQAAAEAKMRRALGQLADGRREFVDHLDDGSPIAVALTIEGERAKIDFNGTGGVLHGNLNANRAIVTAAVMYCLRCLIAEDIPLNQGVLSPVEIVLPECLLNPPEGATPDQCAAVVGGNVETSQRVVDAIFGALGVAAASQGTMNNLLFGDEHFGYYETLCGGSGATAETDGADGVHTHMTNTRLTDPEVLEQRFPVRLSEFKIRRGSGGDGRRRGGNGVLRRIVFLRDLDLSILSQRRGPYPPFGLDGGQPAALGVNTLIRTDGSRQDLGGSAQLRVGKGDVLVIETPGGGGFGKRQ